jgi:hypothetical protein
MGRDISKIPTDLSSAGKRIFFYFAESPITICWKKWCSVPMGYMKFLDYVIMDRKLKSNVVGTVVLYETVPVPVPKCIKIYQNQQRLDPFLNLSVST